MKVTVTCIDCGREMTADALPIIKSIIRCAENGYTFAGTMCERCAEASQAGDDDYLEEVRARKFSYYHVGN